MALVFLKKIYLKSREDLLIKTSIIVLVIFKTFFKMINNKIKYITLVKILNKIPKIRPFKLNALINNRMLKEIIIPS